MMWQLQDGRPHFVLLNFDSATVVSDEDETTVPLSEHHTGSLAFVAVDLLDFAASSGGSYKPALHRLCHDYESLYYVSYWYTVTMLDEADVVKKDRLVSYIRAWETQEFERVADWKDRFRKKTNWGEILPQGALDAGLDRWFESWALVFRKASQHKENVEWANIVADREGPADLIPYDHETMGGFVTRDELRRTLNWEDTDTYDHLMDVTNSDGDITEHAQVFSSASGPSRSTRPPAVKTNMQPAGRGANSRTRKATKSAERMKTKLAARTAAREVASPARQMQKATRRSRRIAKAVRDDAAPQMAESRSFYRSQLLETLASTGLHSDQ